MVGLEGKITCLLYMLSSRHAGRYYRLCATVKSMPLDLSPAGEAKRPEDPVYQVRTT